MVINKRKRFCLVMVVSFIFILTALTSIFASAKGPKKTSDTGFVKYLGSYSTGEHDEDGGVAEIVKYNSDNKKMYIVSGKLQAVDIVSFNDIKSGKENKFAKEKRINISDIGKNHNIDVGDITSVAVNTKKDLIAICVQASDYRANGSIILLDYDGNYIAHTKTGVQPDMITFTEDGEYVLTADEGEPREGYVSPAEDPKGSVTVAKLKNKGFGNTKTILFDEFDSKRAQLIADKVLIKKDSAPSADFEPEYIATSSDSKTAYVSLQEANAIATLDIVNGKWTSIKGLGFKDHSKSENALDLNKDGKIKIQPENVFGIYLPDGIATINIGKKQYILTANEGDAREWGKKPNKYTDIGSKKINGSNKKVEYKLTSEYDGLEDSKTYILGGRSFSILDASTMKQVYDSGKDFETITARVFPKNFNANHKKADIDGRSNKKGPEPEDVQTLIVDDKIYAVIGLERIGGAMFYDITNPNKPIYKDYINIRDFSTNELGAGSDLGAEGICTIEASLSPTGKPIILVANEVSGTVTVLEISDYIPKPNLKNNNKEKDNPKTGIESFIPFYFIGLLGLLVVSKIKKAIK